LQAPELPDSPQEPLGPTISGHVTIVNSTSAPSAWHDQPKVSAATLLPDESAPGIDRFVVLWTQEDVLSVQRFAASNGHS
jgi:hypothetical protein